MVDILFTHSYFLRFDPKEEKAMMPYPPLGTLYAASCARGSGFSVALFDSMLAGDEKEILASIGQHRPRIVVIYDDDFNYLTKMCLTRMREAAFTMSALAKQHGCTVVVHGSDSADHLAEYLAHDADIVIFGEGERTLIEVLGHLLRNEKPKAEIPGIAYLEGGRVERTQERAVVRDLDEFPFPARDLVDTERYRALWLERHGYYSTNIVTTRGCPFHCNWCAKPIYGQVYNTRSPANVVREMKMLKETIQPDHLWFCDDIFGLKPGWVNEFSREVVEQNAVIPFKCLARVDLLLKEDTISRLKVAGCRSVWVGAESGSQKVLDAMEKGTTVAQIYEASRRLKEAGIRVGFFLQYGYPGETLEDIQLTLRMVRECDPDEIGVSVSYPLPGTPFHDRVREQMGGKQNWRDSQDLAMMFAGTYSPDFYRALHHVTHKRFRKWKGLTTLKATVRRPWTAAPSTFRSVAAGLYHSITLPAVERRLAQLATKRMDERPVQEAA
jgi:radical SAM superfamily enzyme YgiQ (UPF0313 family)